jgi:hypothetical protein
VASGIKLDNVVTPREAWAKGSRSCAQSRRTNNLDLSRIRPDPIVIFQKGWSMLVTMKANTHTGVHQLLQTVYV